MSVGGCGCGCVGERLSGWVGGSVRERDFKENTSQFCQPCLNMPETSLI